MAQDSVKKQEPATGSLLSILNHSRDVQDYLAAVESSLIHTSIGEELKKKLEEKCLKPGEVFDMAGIPHSYGYDILSGKRHPSREKVLALFLVMGLNQEEAQDVLKHSSYSTLYAKDASDSVVLFCLQNHKSLMDCNEILDRLGFATLP